MAIACCCIIASALRSAIAADGPQDRGHRNGHDRDGDDQLDQRDATVRMPGESGPAAIRATGHHCTWTSPVPATMVIVCVPTVIVVPGLEDRRPWVSNWNAPAGLAVVLAGAES